MRKYIVAILIFIGSMIISPSAVRADGNFQLDGSTLVSYTGTDSTVIIPKDVTIIGVNAFSKNPKIREVYFPETVTKIGDGAFEYCANLELVVLPKSLTEIGALAFRGCESLEMIEIPEGVGSTGSNCFLECSSLRAASLPSSLYYIEYGIFAACKQLQSISVAKGNSKYTSIDNVIYSANGETLVQYPAGKTGSHYEIRDGVRRIQRSAFNGCDALEEVVLPNTVTELGVYSFKDCHNISEIELPQSITKISDNSFSGCTGLEKVIINNKKASFGEQVFEWNVTLCAAEGSSTENYAESNGLTFEPIKTEDEETEKAGSTESITESIDSENEASPDITKDAESSDIEDGKAQADEEFSEDSKEKKPIDFYRLLFYILIAVAVISLLGIVITVLKMTAANDDRKAR